MWCCTECENVHDLWAFGERNMHRIAASVGLSVPALEKRLRDHRNTHTVLAKAVTADLTARKKWS